MTFDESQIPELNFACNNTESSMEKINQLCKEYHVERIFSEEELNNVNDTAWKMIAEYIDAGSNYL